jgi:hypothetical protein
MIMAHGEMNIKIIHLVHPDNNLPYNMYTGASKYATGAVLMQTNKDGETHIDSVKSVEPR